MDRRFQSLAAFPSGFSMFALLRKICTGHCLLHLGFRRGILGKCEILQIRGGMYKLYPTQKSELAFKCGEK